MQKKHSIKKNACEILAPAGSFEIMKAAFCAGADAVYAGGNLFGARASAVNFSDEELLQAIDYAHLRGKSFYLTVNTLLKDREMAELLYSYLEPLYETGLDAVIVQDLGVMSYIAENFPGLAIHASTQMNLTGSCAAEELKKYGVTRIVTARELSLKEIERIYDSTGLEIESFVHGALCYCYSGQCLMSSVIGGRSGNRGRCAQPCRLAYQVKKDGKTLEIKGNPYILSPKDLCALEFLPELFHAGVYSLKIEGRMKKPEYVAGVTAIYRKYVDRYLSMGEEAYRVDAKDLPELQDLYNRGGFTDGYYHRHNGKEMMSMERPNHRGVEIGEIKGSIEKTIRIKLKQDVNQGDVLEFDIGRGDYDYTSGSLLRAGETLEIKNRFQNGARLKASELKSSRVFRIRNGQLIARITEQYLREECKIKVSGKAVFQIGKPARLMVSDGVIEAVAEVSPVQKADKRPMSAEDIRGKLMKTGATDYIFHEFEIQCDDGVFLPVGELKELRRQAFSQYENNLLAFWRRERKGEKKEKLQPVCVMEDNKPVITALVTTPEQLRMVCTVPYVEEVMIEQVTFSEEELEEACKLAGKCGKKIYLALPHIFRERAYDKKYEYPGISGYLVRNLEEYFFLKERTDLKFIFDEGIYAWNEESVNWLSGYHPERITYPEEMSAGELLKNPMGAELRIYGCRQVMVSAGCVKKNCASCDRKTSVGEYRLEQREHGNYRIITACRECYNLIFEERPVALFDRKEEIRQLHPAALRFHFTFEDAEQMKRIFWEYQQGIHTDSYGYGHFERGVL